MPKAMPADEVMPSKFQRFTSLFVQKGSSSTLRVMDEDKYYVVKREAQGGRILDESILAVFDSEEDAVTYVEQRIRAGKV